MPTKVVFLDTNGWVALLNTRDTLHKASDARWRQLGGAGYSILLTDWIVAETGNTLARTPVRDDFPKAVQRMLRAHKVRLVFLTPSLLERALMLYAERSDKTWGLVDCASFVIMEEEGIKEAFTTDRHFEQAGFKCLLPFDAE